MKEWDNDKHEEALERRRNKKFDRGKYNEQDDIDDSGNTIGDEALKSVAEQ